MTQLKGKTKQAFDRVVTLLECEQLSEVVDLMGIKRAKGDTGVPMDKWSNQNWLMAFITSGGSTDCRGFKQWQKVGRRVNGSSTVRILTPYIRKYKDAETDEERTYIKGFGSVAVWSYEQTTGDPLPNFEYEPSEPPPLTSVAEALNIPITWSPMERNILGEHIHSFGSQRIVLHSEELGVWFHELGHALHTRLGLASLKTRAEKETVAELTSAVLMAVYGFDSTGHAWSYISAYNKDHATQALKNALLDVEAILDFLSTLTSEI